MVLTHENRIFSAVLKIPKLSGWINIRAKAVAELGADLVITSSICQKKLAHELKATGIPVIHLDPRTLDEIADSLMILGQAIGKSAEGQKLAKSFKTSFDDLKMNTQNKHSRLRVYCEEWHKPPTVSGNWVPEVMHIAGADYFPIESGQLSRPATSEEILAFDPEVIFLSICGQGTTTDPSIVLNRQDWTSCTAVKNKNVYVIDDSLLNRPGPRLIEGCLQIKDKLMGIEFY